jgi:amidophosphoribosyltransferase
MCGIVGVVANYPINKLLYNALNGVQHRGQQAAGMATMDGNLMYLRKGIGLISQVIGQSDLNYLVGNAGIGHVRYPTAGSADDPEQAHPFYVNSPFGIMLAHNGNLTNTEQLRNEVLNRNHRHVRTRSDSEVLTNAFAHELQKLTADSELSNDKIFKAIYQLNNRLAGGYAVVSLIADYGLIGFRDPFAIRPLVLGKKESLDGFTSYMLASESCTLNINGFQLIRDIESGEAVIITLDGKIFSKSCHDNPSLNICIFEYAYLARSDSIMEQIPIQLARQAMGKYLAKTILTKFPDLEIDVVIPVPDITRAVAIATAEGLGKPYQEGFVKNHLIGNDKASHDSEQFQTSVINRLSPISLEFKNKNVLLVDTSIVRGNTSREIIKIARNAGAKRVYLASAAPKICYSSVYGVDMPVYTQLIGHAKSDEEVAVEIGADAVIYQELADFKQCLHEINPKLVNFEASCFDGNYISGDINEEFLQSLANGVNH